MGGGGGGSGVITDVMPSPFPKRLSFQQSAEPAAENTTTCKDHDVMLRGRRQGAQPLRFATPQQAEPGVNRPTHHALRNLQSQAGLPSAVGPCDLRPKMHDFSSLNFSTFFNAKSAESAKMDSNRTPSGCPNQQTSNKNAS